MLKIRHYAKPQTELYALRIRSRFEENKIWKIAEMDADHFTAWSKGGDKDSKNCQMLCKTHYRAKGNK